MAESMPRKRKANAKEDVGITLDQIEHLLSTGDVDVRMLKESSRKEILRILITAKEFRYIIDPTYGHSYEITQTNLKTGKVLFYLKMEIKFVLLNQFQSCRRQKKTKEMQDYLSVLDQTIRCLMR